MRLVRSLVFKIFLYAPSHRLSAQWTERQWFKNVMLEENIVDRKTNQHIHSQPALNYNQPIHHLLLANNNIFRQSSPKIESPRKLDKLMWWVQQTYGGHLKVQQPGDGLIQLQNCILLLPSDELKSGAVETARQKSYQDFTDREQPSVMKNMTKKRDNFDKWVT